MPNKTPDMVVRFEPTQRIQHILMIVSITILGLTGVVQSFSQTAWAQAFMSGLGGIEGVRRIHHLASVVLAFVFFHHVVIVVEDMVRNRSKSMLPRFQDVKDAIHTVAYLLGRRSEGPQFDRFDFRQKLEYWSLIWGTVLMGITGLIIMFPAVATGFLPGVVVYAAKAAHGLEALLAIASIVTWHMYNTHFAAGMWPLDTTIFTGRISIQRMLEEHPLEYQRLQLNASLPVDKNESKTREQSMISRSPKKETE